MMCYNAKYTMGNCACSPTSDPGSASTAAAVFALGSLTNNTANVGAGWRPRPLKGGRHDACGGKQEDRWRSKMIEDDTYHGRAQGDLAQPGGRYSALAKPMMTGQGPVP